MASFTENMRMSSLYPSNQRRREPTFYGGQGPGYDMEQNPAPVGFDSIKPPDNTIQQQLANAIAGNKLASLNSSRLNPQSTAPQMMNVREGPNQSPAGTSLQDLDKRNLVKEGAERADRALALKEQTLNQNLDFKYDKQAGDLGMKQKILDLKIPEREKLELLQKYGLDKIEANAQNAQELQGMRGNQQMEQISARGGQTRLSQDNTQANKVINDATAQTSNLAQIAARAAETRQTQASAPISNSQEIVGQRGRAEQLLQSHPEYSGYIKFNPNTKGYDLTDGGDPGVFGRIKNEIYGTGNVNLPPDSSTKPPIKVPTTVKAPVKPASKYKMTTR